MEITVGTGGVSERGFYRMLQAGGELDEALGETVQIRVIDLSSRLNCAVPE